MPNVDDPYVHLRAELLLKFDSAPCDGLKFDGKSSSGIYLPDGVLLNLSGDSDVEHHVTHLHEIYHKSLNDSTAWGTVTQVAFVYPPWREKLFRGLVQESIITHEVFATFKSINLAELHYPKARDVLAGSMYDRYYKRVRRYFSDLNSPAREDLVLTAAVRAAMQTPILEVAASSFPGTFNISDVKLMDRPDQRLARILASREMVPRLVSGADSSVAARFGADVIDSLDSLLSVENPEIDDIWEEWESHFFTAFCHLLSDFGGRSVSFNGHQSDARYIVSRLLEAGYDDLRADPANAGPSTDYDESVAALSRTRFPLRDQLLPANFAYYNKAVDPDDFLRVVSAVASVNGTPELVFHARLAGRLIDSYAWSPDVSDSLEELADRVLVTVRCPTNVGDTDEMEIFHVCFDRPQDVIDVLALWKGRGPSVFCVAASCFVDDKFGSEWVDQLRAHIPVVVLLDVPTRALVGSGNTAFLPDDRETYATYWNLTGTPYSALVWHVDGHPHVCMFIGDSLSTQLVYGQLEDIMSENLSMEDADWSEWETALSNVLRNIQATESFIDLRAFESLRKS